MSSKSQRRQGNPQSHPDAAEGLQTRSTGPTREQALDALSMLLAYAAQQSIAPTIYNQSRLPADAGSVDAYMRRHRALRRAGIPGAWVRGKILACTAEAWATEIAQPKKAKLRAVSSAANIDDALDIALGIRCGRVAR